MSKPQLPAATLGLIVLCLGAAVFTLTNEDALLRWGYTPEPSAALPAHQRVISALTSLFVHLDPLHLLGNMLFLAGVGPAVERSIGPLRLMAVFLVSGLLGVAAHHVASLTVLPATAMEPLAGCSAAVAGIVGYAWLRFRRTRVPLLPKWYVPVWSLGIVWIALQALGAWFSAVQFGASVAYFAHLAGFVAGFALGFVFGAPSQVKQEAWSERVAEAEKRGGAALRATLEQGGSDDAILRLARHLEESGDVEGAAGKYVRVAVSSEPLARAEAVRRLAVLDRVSLIDSADRLRIVDLLERADKEAAALLLESVLAEGDSRDTPAQLSRLVDLHLESDPISAQRAARRLVVEFGPSPEAERVRLRHPDLLET